MHVARFLVPLAAGAALLAGCGVDPSMANLGPASQAPMSASSLVAPATQASIAQAVIAKFKADGDNFVVKTLNAQNGVAGYSFTGTGYYRHYWSDTGTVAVWMSFQGTLLPNGQLAGFTTQEMNGPKGR